MKKILIGTIVALMISCAPRWQSVTKTAISAAVSTVESGAKLALEHYQMKCGKLAVFCSQGSQCDKYEKCKNERSAFVVAYIVVMKSIESAYTTYVSCLAIDDEVCAKKSLEEVVKLVKELRELLKKIEVIK